MHPSAPKALHDMIALGQIFCLHGYKPQLINEWTLHALFLLVLCKV